MTISLYDAAQVEELLDYPGCISAMRRAMIALSSGERPQPLRQIFTVGENEMFGTMPGEFAALSTFGAKRKCYQRRPHRLPQPPAPPISRTTSSSKIAPSVALTIALTTPVPK